MKQSLFFPNLFVTSAIAVCVSQPAWAQLPPIVEITDLRLEATAEGLALVITTADGSPPQFFETRSGNSLVIDLLDARLRLPGGGKEFVQQNPVPGIASITIKQQYQTGVFVTIVGEAEVPVAQVTTTPSGLAVRLPETGAGAIATQPPEFQPPDISTAPPEFQPPEPTSPPTTVPGTEPPTPPQQPTGPEELPEVVVTAEPEPPPPPEPTPEPPPPPPRSPLADRSYTPPKTSSVSRDDSEILDTPQDIDVVTEEIIEDRADRTVGEALENISGVTSGRAPTSSLALTPIIRGFESQNILRNGMRDDTQRFFGGITTNLERIEVLKGPASILFGQGNLGGTVNLVTKVPQPEPFFSFEFRAGEYDFYRPEIDVTGPLNEEGTASYRLAASFETSKTFKDFEDIEERILIAPSIRWDISDRTQMIIEAEYIKEKTNAIAPELPAEGTVLRNPNTEFEDPLPIERNLGEPSLTESFGYVSRVGYRFKHEFSDNWTFKNEFLAAFGRVPEGDGSVFILPVSLGRDLRTLTRLLAENPSKADNFTINTTLVGNFKTWDIAHKLLIGFEYAEEQTEDVLIFRQIDPIDIFNPIYSPESVDQPLTFQDFQSHLNASGFYFQDQITLFDRLIVALGGRFDYTDLTYTDFLREETLEINDQVFSPRVGLVYKITDNISLYGSFARSFEPVIGQSFEGEVFDAERGKQYEVGAKALLLDEKLSLSVSFYDLTRTNQLEQDPENAGFQIQIGEQRSSGFEFDMIGEISPGWNIIGTYSYTDAFVSEDFRPEFQGRKLPNVPLHAASLWTTYTFQEGTFEGLGFGFGLFYQDERQGDLANTFVLPAYIRTDAALFYRLGDMRIAFNFKNIFDHEYFEGSRGRARVNPGAPFTFQGTLFWQF